MGIPRAGLSGATALLVVLTACGGSTPQTASETVGDEVQVSEPDLDPLRQTGPSSYSVVIYSAQGIFDPDEIRIPVGSQVTFRLESQEEMIHGLSIEGTSVEIASSPPSYAKATYTFTEPGEYPFVCHIYCGGGHDIMRGKVVVE
ncbi:MAG: cupredoxin domain-containing protein [Longimicrobiales bacterium]|nr:cupredoxin domain-containing protein [Longimicrobiales bacterium]